MPRASARDRILDCAEELYAEHGLGGVSLRAINTQAGLSPAALHYHFRDQATLVQALLERRMDGLMERRRELLDAIEKGGEEPTARGVVRALVRPMVELLEDEGEEGGRYVRLLARLHADGDLDRDFVVTRYRGGVDRLEPLLRRALPEHDAGLLRLRLGLAIELVLRSLANTSLLTRAGGPSRRPLDLEELETALLDFLEGALEARSSLQRRRRRS